jgi:hypothetical protein
MLFAKSWLGNQKRNAYSVLVGKPEERIPFGRLRCRWEYSIKVDIKETLG